LNLHQSCRTVVNLELPWNPMRLEQRIGRVDRIGQKHTVHAFHLLADGTGELRILSRLRERIDAAKAAIGAPDPLAIAELAIDEP
jgi:SNF2 family DNA or RNA helicase